MTGYDTDSVRCAPSAAQASSQGYAQGPGQTPAQAGAFDVIQALASLCSSAAFIYLLVSGRYAKFVTPRLVPVLWIAALALLAWGAAGILHIAGVYRQSHPGICRGDGRADKGHNGNSGCCGGNNDGSSYAAESGIHIWTRWLGLLVLLLPVTLLAVPYAAFASTLATSLGSPPAYESSFSSGQSESGKLPGLDRAKKAITIDAAHFGPWFEEIGAHPDVYSGYSVTVAGFVEHTAMNTGKDFTVSRMLMTCCVQDMTAFGFTVKGNSAVRKAGDSVREHQWVMVTGKIRTYKSASRDAEDGVAIEPDKVERTADVQGYFYR
mgnify:CR=1 FL=1